MLEVTVPQVEPEDVAAGSVTCAPLVGVSGVSGSWSASKFSVASAVTATFDGQVSEQVGLFGFVTVVSTVELLLDGCESVVVLEIVVVSVKPVPVATDTLSL